MRATRITNTFFLLLLYFFISSRRRRARWPAARKGWLVVTARESIRQLKTITSTTRTNTLFDGVCPNVDGRRMKKRSRPWRIDNDDVRESRKNENDTNAYLCADFSMNVRYYYFSIVGRRAYAETRRTSTRTVRRRPVVSSRRRSQRRDRNENRQNASRGGGRRPPYSRVRTRARGNLFGNGPSWSPAWSPAGMPRPDRVRTMCTPVAVTSKGVFTTERERERKKRYKYILWYTVVRRFYFNTLFVHNSRYVFIRVRIIRKNVQYYYVFRRPI